MWNLNSSDRLHEWKLFREDISALPLEKALEKTNHLWSYAPFVNYYISPDRSPEWPDPWTLLHENYYCDIAKSLGIMYTLHLCSHYGNGIDSMEMKIYNNPKTHESHNTVWINNGKYILNLIFDEVVNKSQLDKKLVLQYTHSVEDLNLNL